ncbi:hypothetical protein EBT16_02490 [bacterium]|nr:hypothetical protein [bacterium]
MRDKLFKAFDEKFLSLWKSRDFCDILEIGADWADSLENSGIVLHSRGGVESVLDPYTLRVNFPTSPKLLVYTQMYLHVPEDLKEKILVLGLAP